MNYFDTLDWFLLSDRKNTPIKSVKINNFAYHSPPCKCSSSLDHLLRV